MIDYGKRLIELAERGRNRPKKTASLTIGGITVHEWWWMPEGEMWIYDEASIVPPRQWVSAI